MAKIDAVFRREFEIKLFEMYPDVQTRGVVSRPELLNVMKSLKTDKYPLWMMKDKVGRGLYAIDGGTYRAQHDAEVKGNNVLKVESVKQESFVVDYTDTKALIPVKDPNFVPFGNYSDLEDIIKSAIFILHIFLVQLAMVSQRWLSRFVRNINDHSFVLTLT